MVFGARAGGWIEFQLGPFRNDHWKKDSLYLDAIGSGVVGRALAAAMGSFDAFQFYEDLPTRTVTRIIESLTEHAEAARTGDHDPRTGEGNGGAVFGDMDVALARRLVADTADGIAEWLSRALARHPTLSILGA